MDSGGLPGGRRYTGLFGMGDNAASEVSMWIFEQLVELTIIVVAIGFVCLWAWGLWRAFGAVVDTVERWIITAIAAIRRARTN